MSKKDERTIEMSLEIDAPADVVWKALTDAKELVRWFPLKAEIEPRVGGRYWMSWEGEFEGESRIEIHEPGRRLKTSMESTTREDGRPAQLAVDYHLEGRGGRTALRLVHSGFGRGADWDDEYEAIRTGWTFELRGLRHYLERHRGQDRQAIFVVGRASDLSGAEVWERVVGEGFGAPDPAGLGEGDRHSFPVGEGTVFEGTVLDAQPSRQLAMTVNSLNDGIFRIEVFGARPHLWLAAWGEDREAVARFEAPWREMLSRVLPGAVAGATHGS
jgi:uncharacterized protein YndB with AHSA1/START domain